MELGLDGKSAIVTGGTRGIGRATAEVLAAEGCGVGVCARSEEDVGATVERLEGEGVAAFGRALDVADAEALERWVRDAADALGGLDVVVPNVSALGGGEGEGAWRRSFEVDIMHTVRTVETALPSLREGEGGAIVVVSTGAAREVGAFEGPYATVKAALVRYAKGLSVELAPEGVRVNAVSPGTIYAEDGTWARAEREDPEFFEEAVGWNPMGRMGTPEEVARAVAFLASPAASFVSGTNLLVDGALTRAVQL
jgi:NAD(P)-dependent dehydrogenase (short-subunit alcohol dehydrogenase family)